MYLKISNMACLELSKTDVSSLKSMIYVGLRVKVQVPLSQGLKPILVIMGKKRFSS